MPFRDRCAARRRCGPCRDTGRSLRAPRRFPRPERFEARRRRRPASSVAKSPRSGDAPEPRRPGRPNAHTAPAPARKPAPSLVPVAAMNSSSTSGERKKVVTRRSILPERFDGCQSPHLVAEFPAGGREPEHRTQNACMDVLGDKASTLGLMSGISLRFRRETIG